MMGIRMPDAKKPATPIKKISDKKAKQIAEEKTVAGKLPSALALKKWFADIEAEHCSNGMGICQECGAAIPKAFFRAATAHLLPKKLFKSVAAHPLNYLVLGAACGCHYKTDRVDQFIKMKVWPEAARRIKIMIADLPHDELKYLSSQLLRALDETKTD